MSKFASPLDPPILKSDKSVFCWNKLYGSAGGLTIAQAATQQNGLVIVVTRDNRHLRLLHNEVQFYRSDNNARPLLKLPDWECLPYDLFSPHHGITSERLRTLATLPTMHDGLLFVTLETLMQRLPPPGYVLGQTFVLSCQESLDVEIFRARLQSSGYRSVSRVMEPGEYAIRGGVIDIFSLGFSQPFRLDLFGSEIESICYFDPNTQRSLERIPNIDIHPAREFPVTQESIGLFRKNFRAKFKGDPQLHRVYRELSKGNIPPGLDYYFPLFFSEIATIFDYVPSSTCWIVNPDLETQANALWAQIVDRYETASKDIERQPMSPEDLYMNPDLFQEQLNHYHRVSINNESSIANGVDFSSRLPEEFSVNTNSTKPYSRLISHLQNTQHRILIVAETPGRLEALDDVLTHNSLTVTRVNSWDHWVVGQIADLGLAIGSLERGLFLPNDKIEVITETQLYGELHHKRKRHPKTPIDPESVIRSLAELSIGDPVVHEEQGVGRYRGLHTLGIDGQETEFLVLEYQDGDRLYVPILSLKLVSRYVGGDSKSAPLHKLGTEIWDKSKKRARERAYDVAVELLEMNALRASAKGYHFQIPVKEYRTFVDRFSFEETPDQTRVISEVLDDLSSDRAMDRLVCGDVGFGKTEVALRAAFVTVHNQKQVALLVPTTILAQQHFETFRNRFANDPIQIELLSRFRAQKEMKKVVESLPSGYPDIVIGTHRLLQKDVVFRDLGLLIIDEEHRFGVRQKETLKSYRKTADVLSLTATPIPRTLNISLSGLRSISLISTPPLDRKSIKTFVCEWNNNLIREACLREIHRGGQVFFLHNKVRTIPSIEKQLTDLVPEAEIRIAHGQMPKRDLEWVMNEFYHQRFNILICTTIIESGIDLPNANTIIIRRADKFGLAQLHQLRGRVGRSHHQAYAYLITPPRDALPKNAEKRLDAITKLEELGSGFMLASHDLEIRGAGELLGESQSGAIDEVGFSLYSQYLERAIQEIKSKNTPNQTSASPDPQGPADLRFNIPALFPEAYLPDVHARLVFYKRIAGAKSAADLHELQLEALDRFGGPLPDPAKSLFRIAKLQLHCHSIGICRFLLDQSGGKIEFVSKPTIDPRLIIALIQEQPGVFRMTNNESLQIKKRLIENSMRLEFAESLLMRFLTE